MRSGLTAFGLVAATVVSAAAAAAPNPPASDELASLLGSFRRERGLPAVAAAVATADRVLAADAVGQRKLGDATPIAPDAAFAVGSVSCAMTATLAAVLVEEGVLGWDTTLEQALPELGRTALPGYRTVTLEQWLAHRSGLPGDAEMTRLLQREFDALSGGPVEQRRQLARAALRVEPRSDPGTGGEFSRIGYVVAGAMLEAAARRPWERLLEERVFAPLGMTKAALETGANSDGPWGHRAGDAGLVPVRTGPALTYSVALGPLLGVRGSILDLTRFAQRHLRAGAGADGFLGPDAFVVLQRDMTGSGFSPAWRVSMSASGGTTLGAGGCVATHCAALTLLPAQGLAVAVATTAGGPAAEAAMNELQALIAQRFQIEGAALRSGPRDPAAQGPATAEAVRRCLAESRYDAAERGARELLAAAERGRERDSSATAEALDLLVEALLGSRAGDPRAAVTLAERAIAIKERTLGPDAPALVRSLTRLGELHASWAGSPAAAERPLERALEIGRRRLGPQHPEVIEAGFWLGKAKAALAGASELAAARGLFETHVRWHELALARGLRELADTEARLGYVDSAIERLERALGLVERAAGPRSPSLVAPLTRLGELRTVTGDYVQAVRRLEAALSIAEGEGAVDDASGAALFEALARARLELGLDAEARTALERAASIDGHAVSVDVLLAQALRAAGDADGARGLLSRLVARARERPEDFNVSSLTGLTALLQESGASAEARELYERSAARFAGAPFAAEILNGQARLLLDAGDTERAATVLRQALEAGEAAYGTDHVVVGRTLELVAQLQVRAGRPQLGLAPALRAEQIRREHLRLVVRSLPERQALRYAASRSAALDLALSLVAAAKPPSAADVRAAWDELIRSRAVVLDEMAARQRSAVERGNPELRELAAEVSQARGRLAQLAVRSAAGDDPAAQRAVLEEARRAKERVEGELAARSAPVARELAGARIGYADVLRSLPRDGALVAFARYVPPAPRDAAALGAGADEAYLAFVVRADGEPAAIALGGAVEIDALVSRWREQVSAPALFGARDRGEALHAAGGALRATVWDPLGPLIGDARRVLVVADGALLFVSFAALPVGATEYLLERGPLLHYLSSERDAVDDASSRTPGRGLLAVGDPAYEDATLFSALGGSATQPAPMGGVAPFRGARSACRAFHALRFDALPESATEARGVAAAWSDSATGGGPPVIESADRATLLVGAAASEAAIKAQGPGRRVLHLATHGFFLDGSCGPRSGGARGMALAPAAEGAPGAPVENPLLMSGLALAGANLREAAERDEEDGILTAEEIAALDLGSVEWAVLSACDTGLGQIAPGEGVLGLRRAFEVAGARTLIMSLWPVEDRAAASWMRALYAARFAGGMDTAEAVHEASRSVLAERRRRGESTHPFFWAGFVAAGDWR